MIFSEKEPKTEEFFCIIEKNLLSQVN